MPGYKNATRIARGLPNLGGVVTIDLFSEDDFLATTLEFPLESAIATGEITGTAFPTAAGFLGAARIKFDSTECKVDSEMVGGLGYQGFKHKFTGKMAGNDKAQVLAVQSFRNRPAVCVATMPDGTRQLLGTLLNPLTIKGNWTTGDANGEKQYEISGEMENPCAFTPPVINATVIYTLLP